MYSVFTYGLAVDFNFSFEDTLSAMSLLILKIKSKNNRTENKSSLPLGMWLLFIHMTEAVTGTEDFTRGGLAYEFLHQVATVV
jgi:hypothetical protein